METAKGFSDFTGEDARKREEIVETIKSQFEKFGFEPAETPIIEYLEFVKGENPNDEAVRDVFKLEDRGKRKLGLRYEFTFQLKRIANNKKLPYKRFQIGYNFRDEPIKKGRLRQFIQCDADVVGSTNKEEAEILAMTGEILEKLGIEYTISINNRKLLNEILEKAGVKKTDFVEVIKEIDKLGKLTEKEIKQNLKKYNAEKVLDIFQNKEEFFKKYSEYKEVEELKKICKELGIKVVFKPSLARGLSYYNGTIFEIESKELNVSIAGGGSYLINGIQATGIALGLEPLFLISKLSGKSIDYIVVSLGEDKEAWKIAQKLRENNNLVTIFYGKPSKALEYANSYKIKNAIFVGEEEVKSKKFLSKNLETGKEKEIKF